jgi:hypothetical protein
MRFTLRERAAAQHRTEADAGTLKLRHKGCTV